MIRALALAVGQLGDPGSRRVVWLGIAGAVLGFAALATLVWYALFHTAVTEIAWADDLLDWVGVLAVPALAWILFPAAVTSVASFLLDDVVDRVEARHYPQLAPAPRLPVGEEAVNALRLFGTIALVNLLALPAYLLLPGLNLLLYYSLNGYLLGREYFGLVANRRVGRKEAAYRLRAGPLRPFLAGVIIAFLSTVPLVNLFVPVIGSAFMVHVFHGATGHLRPAG